MSKGNNDSGSERGCPPVICTSIQGDTDSDSEERSAHLSSVPPIQGDNDSESEVQVELVYTWVSPVICISCTVTVTESKVLVDLICSCNGRTG